MDFGARMWPQANCLGCGPGNMERAEGVRLAMWGDGIHVQLVAGSSWGPVSSRHI